LTGSFDSFAVLGPVLAGSLLLGAFVVHALRRGQSALIDVRLLRVRAFASAGTTILLSSSVLFGAVGLLPLYYQQVRGEDALHTGLLLIPFGVGMGVSLMIYSARSLPPARPERGRPSAPPSGGWSGSRC
jgi:hypothetical protein